MEFRKHGARTITAAPNSFDGKLQQLFDHFIQPNLPDITDVEHLHKRLIDYCSKPDPVFVVRQVSEAIRYSGSGPDHFGAEERSLLKKLICPLSQ